MKLWMKKIIWIAIVITSLSGQHWTDDIHLFSPGISNGGSTPSIAVAPNGVVHAVWMEMAEPTYYNPVAIHYARSDDYGETWAIRCTLTELYPNRHYYQPAIAISNNYVHVVWVDVDVPNSYQGRICYRRSIDSGINWEDPVLLDSVGTNWAPSITSDAYGNVNVVWTDKYYNNYSYYAFEVIHSSNRGENWGNVIPLYISYGMFANFLSTSIVSDWAVPNKVHIAGNIRII
ncbi:MAG: sialidase family protein, partial [candidate division WOR-3 bacterium]